MEFGPYTVADPADRKEGGQAFVYFSVDSRSGLEVAIKVARPSAWSRDRMEKEIKVQQSLDHPNILPILAHGDDLRWHATRRAVQSLEDHGPFARNDWTALRVGLLGVVSAVDYAHAKKRVHRDISPGNTLILPDRWVVSDWGFVYEPPKRGAPRMTQHLERFGTPEFMAPEMVVDPRSAGAPADIFSIGRLAAWGTGLKRADARPDDDSATTWWRQLIDHTTAWDPADRWTMRDVETYLRSKLAPVNPIRAVETLVVPPDPTSATVIRISDRRLRHYVPCPRCGSTEGSDPNDHCLGCHAMLGY